MDETALQIDSRYPPTPPKHHPPLTGTAADGGHGGDGSPGVALRVVTLSRAQAGGAVKPPHGVKEPVQHCHSHPNAPRQHGGHQLPLVPLRLVPGVRGQAPVRPPQGRFGGPPGRPDPPGADFPPPQIKYMLPGANLCPSEVDLCPPLGQIHTPRGTFVTPRARFIVPGADLSPSGQDWSPQGQICASPRQDLSPRQGKIHTPRGRFIPPQGQIYPAPSPSSGLTPHPLSPLTSPHCCDGRSRATPPRRR